MMKIAGFALALAVSATGCADGVGPEQAPPPGPAGPPELTAFTVVQLRADVEPKITVAGAARGITVDGVLYASDPCWTLSGEMAVAALADEPVLALTVDIRRRGGVCGFVLTSFAYSARVQPVPPGRNRVQVWYRKERVSSGDLILTKVFDGYVKVSARGSASTDATSQEG